MTDRLKVRAGCHFDGQHGRLTAGEIVPADEPTINIERQRDALEPAPPAAKKAKRRTTTDETPNAED